MNKTPFMNSALVYPRNLQTPLRQVFPRKIIRVIYQLVGIIPHYAPV